MADVAADAPPQPRRSRLPLLIGLVLALLSGGGGFYAVYSGLLFGPLLGGGHRVPPALADSGFVPLQPLLVSLGDPAQGRHLRFAATLEVPHGYESDVERLMPRLLDVLNGYLRAIAPEEFSAPGALIRLRAQMLRRMQIVAGEGRVRDLLVTEFVLN